VPDDNDDVLDSCSAKGSNDPRDEGFVAEREQRLGAAHASRLACGEDERRNHQLIMR